MEKNNSDVKVLELPNWVKVVNELVKKEQLKSPKYPAEKRSNL